MVGVRGQPWCKVCGWTRGQSVAGIKSHSVARSRVSIRFGSRVILVCDREQQAACIQMRMLPIIKVKDQMG